MADVKLIECPRDAWQGLANFIPTEVKVSYLAGLLHAGFRNIDAVSFVSPKHVPQMADSEAVMRELERREPALLGKTEIIAIVVNDQGFRRAEATEGVTTIGYPYSISETFTRQNANMSQAESRQLVEKMESQLGGGAMGPAMNEIDMVIYISMAFGNPYGDPWGPEMVLEAIEWLKRIGVHAVSLADTVGKARAENVGELFRAVRAAAPDMEIGVHLHSRRDGAAEKVLAAYEAGCRRFDSALTGLGGCPFAGDELVGNIPTEIVVNTLQQRGVSCGIEPPQLAAVLQEAEALRAQFAH